MDHMAYFLVLALLLNGCVVITKSLHISGTQSPQLYSKFYWLCFPALRVLRFSRGMKWNLYQTTHMADAAEFPTAQAPGGTRGPGERMCWFVLGRHCVCILCHEGGTIVTGPDLEMGEKQKPRSIMRCSSLSMSCWPQRQDTFRTRFADSRACTGVCQICIALADDSCTAAFHAGY